MLYRPENPNPPSGLERIEKIILESNFLKIVFHVLEIASEERKSRLQALRDYLTRRADGGKEKQPSNSNQ